MIEVSEFNKQKMFEESQADFQKFVMKKYQEFLSKTENFQKIQTKQKLKSSSYLKDIIVLKSGITDNVSLFELIRSGNKNLDKILITLVYICEEISFTIQQGEIKCIQKLNDFGIDSENGCDLNSIIELFKLLHDVWSFYNRSKEILDVLLTQILALSKKDSYIPLAQPNLLFRELIKHIADLLIFIETLERLLAQGVIKANWNRIHQLNKLLYTSRGRFDFDSQEISTLCNVTDYIEKILLNESIFQDFLQNAVPAFKVLQITKNKMFSYEINLFIQKTFNSVSQNSLDTNRHLNCLRINVLMVFHFHFFGTFDKKLFKIISEMNKQVCAISLTNNILWYPEVFLNQHAKNLLEAYDKKWMSTMKTSRQTLVSKTISTIIDYTLNYVEETCSWIKKLEDLFKIDKKPINTSELQEHCEFLLEGLVIVKKINSAIRWITNIHILEKKAMSKNVLTSIFILNTLLRGISNSFQKYSVEINLFVNIVSQYYCQYMTDYIRFLRKEMMKTKTYKDNEIDMLLALNICENLLCETLNSRRILILNFVTPFISLFAGETLNEFLIKYESIFKIYDTFIDLCDSSFLSNHLELLTPHFNNFFHGTNKISKTLLEYDFDGFFEKSKRNKTKAVELILELYGDYLITPLKKSIEETLRIESHCHLKISRPLPFEISNYQSKYLLAMKPIKIFDQFLNIKANVEDYLSSTFYNITTVANHDWEIYTEMRQLAYFKHKLEIIEDELPIQTIDQSLDILEIMRNIKDFVANYYYNLNNQIFIAKFNKSKYLTTLNIIHVSNSIRMHGIGVMNTTVNYTYQFLQKNFHTFSQFLYDEMIKSRLIADIEYFRKNIHNLKYEMYPFERAEKFNRAIRRLGLNESGESYLDLFRDLITRIGNALGYIRMVKSGGRHYCSNAINYISSEEYNALKTDVLLEETSKDCLNFLIKETDNLIENFNENTEYFKLLMDVFSPKFRSAAFEHLRNFYMILPPLTLNFIEYSLTCREKLAKGIKNGATFTDDGFALGVAFILKLLNQTTEFEALNWFFSADHKYKSDLEKMKNLIESKKDDIKLQQTLPLTEKRIMSYKTEFELLYYNINSSMIFFYNSDE